MPILPVTVLVLTKARLLLKARVVDRNSRRCSKTMLNVVLLVLLLLLFVEAPRVEITPLRLAPFCPWESLILVTVIVSPRSALVCGTSKCFHSRSLVFANARQLLLLFFVVLLLRIPWLSATFSLLATLLGIWLVLRLPCTAFTSNQRGSEEVEWTWWWITS
jgi:hypothetical protein